MDQVYVRHTIDLDGPVDYLDFGGEGDPLVLVHGLGGSAENWLSAAPLLARSHRTVAVDLRGFGRSPLRDGQSADVHSNRALLEAFIETLFDKPVTLVGNSMGGMISLLQGAARPGQVRALVLVDPALPYPPGTEADPVVAAIFGAYATPGAGEELLRTGAAQLGPEGMVRQTMALCCVDCTRVDPVVMEAHIVLAHERAQMAWANDAFLQAARSLIDLNVRADEYLETIRSIRLPALIVQGDSDRLIPLAATRALAATRPDWKLVVVEDTGHTPQLERPDRFVASVLDWLSQLPEPQEVER